MAGRFTNLPQRLRNGAELIGLSGHLDISEVLAISATMQDAALKIEALERDLKNARREIADE